MLLITGLRLQRLPTTSLWHQPPHSPPFPSSDTNPTPLPSSLGPRLPLPHSTTYPSVHFKVYICVLHGNTQYTHRWCIPESVPSIQPACPHARAFHRLLLKAYNKHIPLPLKKQTNSVSIWVKFPSEVCWTPPRYIYLLNPYKYNIKIHGRSWKTYRTKKGAK